MTANGLESQAVQQRKGAICGDWVAPPNRSLALPLNGTYAMVHVKVADDGATTFVGMERLRQLMQEHMNMPFPDSVEKGTEYGGVDCAMVGADVYGWATRVSEGESVPVEQWTALDGLATDLRTALPQFPAEARPYYAQVAELAGEVLRHRP